MVRTHRELTRLFSLPQCLPSPRQQVILEKNPGPILMLSKLLQCSNQRACFLHESMARRDCDWGEKWVASSHERTAMLLLDTHATVWICSQ